MNRIQNDLVLKMKTTLLWAFKKKKQTNKQTLKDSKLWAIIGILYSRTQQV